MELEIEEKLQEIYKKLIINVEFIDFRLYNIKIKLEFLGLEYDFNYEYRYMVDLTLDANIRMIEEYIDRYIIINFYKR